MTFKHLILASSAALAIAWPATTEASAAADQQPVDTQHQQQTPPPKGKGGPQGQHGPQGPQGRAGGQHGGPGSQGGQHGQGGGGQTSGGQSSGGRTSGRGQHGPTGPAGSTGGQGHAPSGGAGYGAGGHGPQPLGPLPGAQGSHPSGLSGWSRGRRGPERDRNAGQWRQHNPGWDRSSPWKRDRDWWKTSPAFRLYHGPRLHYLFIPMWGYVQMPSAYWGHHWRPGEYLPRWFWRYRVSNYWTYGLPAPPPGCAWLWVDHDIALVDLSDGYIVDMVYNVW
ncbi:MAG: RcnB family protein [Proteobacteria bacterium]|nr:RcnB family protein [Pseudomonadota bacterium]